MKQCLMCGESFSGKRSDSLYCSSSCKARYFELNKKKQKPLQGIEEWQLLPRQKSPVGDLPFELKLPTTDDPKPQINTVRNADQEALTPFDNISDDTEELSSTKTAYQNNINAGEAEPKKEEPLPQRYINKDIQKENPLYTANRNRVTLIDASISKCSDELVRLNQCLKQTENDSGNRFLLAGLAGGGLLAYFLQTFNKTGPTRKKKTPFQKAGNLIGIVLSLTAGALIGQSLRSDYNKNNTVSKVEALRQIRSRINEVREIKEGLLKERDALKQSAFFIKEKIIETVRIENPEYKKALQEQNLALAFQTLRESLINKSKTNPETTSENPFEGIGNNFSQPEKSSQKKNPLETDLVKSMKHVAGMKFQILNFTGKWLAFFGLPQTNFMCVIHGMSGEGKTNFSIQFAKYLAENFGNVLYVSGEEGFAPTFQQKIKTLGADRVPRLYAADIRTGDELLRDIPNKYHFIVIDSLNNMNIDPDVMKSIRNRFKQSGIIAICQSTKDGKVRGSYQIIHDSDIAVKVINGIAVTTKNRFKEKHQEFDVFAAYKTPNPKIIKLIPKDSLDEDFKNTSY